MSVSWCESGHHNRYTAFLVLQAGSLDVQVQGLAIVCNIYLHREVALCPVSQFCYRKPFRKVASQRLARARGGTQIKEPVDRLLIVELADVSRRAAED